MLCGNKLLLLSELVKGFLSCVASFLFPAQEVLVEGEKCVVLFQHPLYKFWLHHCICIKISGIILSHSMAELMHGKQSLPKQSF